NGQQHGAADAAAERRPRSDVPDLATGRNRTFTERVVGEGPPNAEHLIVSPAGIERRLHDDVRRDIGRNRYRVQEPRADVGDVGNDAVDGHGGDAAGGYRTDDAIDRRGIFDRDA